MSFEVLKDDNRRSCAADWEKWLREADKLHSRYLKEIGDSPFTFNEISAVSFLSAAAARVGYLTLNEYSCVKKDKEDRRFKKAGRADLWLTTGPHSYSFEFKRAYYAATPKNLAKTLGTACDDINVVDKSESHSAAAVVLAYVRDEKRKENYHNFANRENVDFSYRIGPSRVGGCFLFFSIKK